MFDMIPSSLRSWATVASRKRRSASLSDDSDLSRTSERKGETGSVQHVVGEPRHQTLQEADCECGVEAETWKRRAQEAEKQLRLFEAEANRRFTAQQVEFDQRMQRQASDAEDRANLLLVAPRLEQDLRHTKEELQKTIALLETRSAELRDAQAYLTRLDDVADAEVLQLVGGINSRIFQVAASIADAFESRYGELKGGRMMQEAVGRLDNLMGRGLLSVLIPIDHTPDPLAVQTVLQAVMVSYVTILCRAWSFCVAEPSNFPQKVYYSMRQTEQQSVAGRWRALCLTYTKKMFPDEAERRLAAKDELLRRITDTLLASGVAQPPQEVLEEVESNYADMLREIIRLSHEFQRTTVERIISRDLVIVTVTPGKSFDPSRMVDEWADPKTASRGRVDADLVLCTTQLGVIRAERVATEGAGGEGEISQTVLLKPKVVLTTFLEELRSEASS